MKTFEAMYKLADSDKLEFTEYAECLNTLIEDCVNFDIVNIYSNFAILCSDDKKTLYLATDCYYDYEDYEIHSYTDGKIYNTIVAIISLSEVFFNVSTIKYEHWFGPDLPNEYDIPKYYSSFGDLIKYLCQYESEEYFVENDDFFIMPAYSKDGKFAWNVFLNIEEENRSYMVGRMTVS